MRTKLNYLEIFDATCINYRKYPLISKSNRRFISAFYFDHENNNIVATNGKSLICVTANVIEQEIYKNKNFISLDNKEIDDNSSFPPYKKVLIDDNDSTFRFAVDLKTLIKQLKLLKKHVKYFINTRWNEPKVYYNTEVEEFLICNEPFTPNFEIKRFSLKLILDSLITLYNLRGNSIYNPFHTNLTSSKYEALKIDSHPKFNIIIMPMQN